MDLKQGERGEGVHKVISDRGLTGVPIEDNQIPLVPSEGGEPFFYTCFR